LSLFEDVAKDLIVIVCAGVAGYLLGRAKEFFRMRKFRMVFGHGVISSSDLTVSAPLWFAPDTKREHPRFVKADYFGNRANLHGPDEVYSRDDMLAATYIINVIGNHFFELPLYSNDAEEPIWNSKTIIILGAPLANYHAKFYLDRIRSSKIYENIPIFAEFEETEETGSACCIHIPKSNTNFQFDKKRDYGVVLRIPSIFAAKKQNYVFIIAGISSYSTQEAGRLFNMLWPSLANKKRANGFVFEMDYQKPGTGQIVYEIS
jgi:hypothetical protein